MKLSQCTMGIIVQREDGEIGHIVDLTHTSTDYPGGTNNDGTVIPVVKWAYSQFPKGIHHNNIKIYKD